MKKTTILLATVLVVLTGCNTQPPEKKTGLANPASVYCETQGGNLDIREDKEGNQTGYCLFKDGSECEEWAFFRKECQKERGLMQGADDNIGGNCGTVTPNQRNACCKEQMKDEPEFDCLGEWQYSEDISQCEFTCFEEMVGSSCGTVTPGEENNCCQVAMENEDHPRCDGDWYYNQTHNACEYICDANIIFGDNCGTVTPGEEDACCTEQNKDAVTPLCIGHWKYNPTKADCEYLCDTDQIIGDSCGTVTPGEENSCCAEKMKDELTPDCIGEWRYTPEEDNECSFICEETDKKVSSGSPAATFCNSKNGTLEIRKAEDGSETGYCVFENGKECEEWAFFRGECSI